MATLTNRMLWAVLVLSQLIYVVVVYLKEPSPGTSEETGPMFLALLTMAVALGVGSLVYRKRALVEPIRTGRLDPSTPAGAARAFSPFVINLAVSQSVAIYGLVLSFLSNEPLYTVGFVAAGLTLMVLHRPTAPALQAPAGRPFPTGPPPI